MIAEVIDEVHYENSKKIRFVIEINEIDNWKFRRWFDVINSYDDSRKSTNAFNQLVKEIQEDYDKDFRDDEIW